MTAIDGVIRVILSTSRDFVRRQSICPGTTIICSLPEQRLSFVRHILSSDFPFEFLNGVKCNSGGSVCATVLRRNRLYTSAKDILQDEELVGVPEDHIESNVNFSHTAAANAHRRLTWSLNGATIVGKAFAPLWKSGNLCSTPTTSFTGNSIVYVEVLFCSVPISDIDSLFTLQKFTLFHRSKTTFRP